MKPTITDCAPVRPHFSIASLSQRGPKSVLSGVAIFLAAAICASSAAEINSEVQYLYSAGRGEGISVSKNGRTVLLSSPTDISGGTETTFSSSVPTITHQPTANEPFEQTSNLPLPGEVTDVAALLHHNFHLAVVRGDSASSLNALIAFKGDQILQTIPMPAKPDGMEVTPDGAFAIVAVEKGGEIRIYDLSAGAGNIALAALISKPALAAYYAGMPERAGAGGVNIEPEAIGIAPDSSFALVTIQDSASIAAVDLTQVLIGLENGLTPEEIGDLALKNVVHLPFGFVGQNGALFGVEPDGVAISPDGTFAMIAHEANQRAKHIQGFSILDLRGGLSGEIPQKSYNIFDVDPSLLSNTGLTAPPPVNAAAYPADANKLPRLDPASVEMFKSAQDTIAALVIERYDPSSAQLASGAINETRGSVLFLNVTNALDSIALEDKLVRLPLGAAASRLEGIDSAQHGRWIFVSVSNGGGEKPSAARIQVNH